MKTFNDGAHAERTTWLAKLRRELRSCVSPNTADFVNFMIRWGLARDERTKKRKGGVGRK